MKIYNENDNFYDDELSFDLGIPTILAWLGISENIEKPNDFNQLVKDLKNFLSTKNYVDNDIIFIKTYFTHNDSYIPYLPEQIIEDIKIFLWEKEDPLFLDYTFDITQYSEEAQNILLNYARNNKYYCIAYDNNHKIWIGWSNTPFQNSLDKNNKSFIETTLGQNFNIWYSENNYIGETTAAYAFNEKFYETGINDSIIISKNINVNKIFSKEESVASLQINQENDSTVTYLNNTYYSFSLEWKNNLLNFQQEAQKVQEIKIPHLILFSEPIIEQIEDTIPIVPEEPAAPTEPDKYLVLTSSLIQIADLLREKAEISTKLTMPTGYLEAINKVSENSKLPKAEGTYF